MRQLLTIATLLLAAAVSPAAAQSVRVDREAMKNSDSIKLLFKPVIAAAEKSTVLVKLDGKQAAFGAIVDKDGYILTKASDIGQPGKLTVTTSAGQNFPAKIVGVAGGPDLAMLKIDAPNLPALIPVEWGDAKKLEVGQWVATPGTSDEPVAVGVISVGRRKIPGRNGFLGVSLGDAEDAKNGGGGGAKIAQVLPDSAAEKAGLQVDDIITAVNGTPTKNRVDLIMLVRDFHPGDVVKLSIKRGDKSLEVSATLGANLPGSSPRFDLQNLLGGAVSKRASDFAAVYQHDTVLRPADCGGPLVDLSGKVVGLNIARAGRTETYALPADLILPLLPDLKSGRLAPKPDTPATTQHHGQE